MITYIRLAPIEDFKNNLKDSLNRLSPQTISKFALAMRSRTTDAKNDLNEKRRMINLDNLMQGKSTLAQVKNFDKILQVLYTLIETADRPTTINTPSEGLAFISGATSIERTADYKRYCRLFGLRPDDQLFDILIALGIAIMPFVIKAAFSVGAEDVLKYYYVVCNEAHLPTIKM